MFDEASLHIDGTTIPERIPWPWPADEYQGNRTARVGDRTIDVTRNPDDDTLVWILIGVRDAR